MQKRNIITQFGSVTAFPLGNGGAKNKSWGKTLTQDQKRQLKSGKPLVDDGSSQSVGYLKLMDQVFPQQVEAFLAKHGYTQQQNISKLSDAVCVITTKHKETWDNGDNVKIHVHGGIHAGQTTIPSMLRRDAVMEQSGKVTTATTNFRVDDSSDMPVLVSFDGAPGIVSDADTSSVDARGNLAQIASTIGQAIRHLDDMQRVSGDIKVPNLLPSAGADNDQDQRKDIVAQLVAEKQQLNRSNTSTPMPAHAKILYVSSGGGSSNGSETVKVVGDTMEVEKSDLLEAVIGQFHDGISTLKPTGQDSLHQSTLTTYATVDVTLHPAHQSQEYYAALGKHQDVQKIMASIYHAIETGVPFENANKDQQEVQKALEAIEKCEVTGEDIAKLFQDSASVAVEPVRPFGSKDPADSQSALTALAAQVDDAKKPLEVEPEGRVLEFGVCPPRFVPVQDAQGVGDSEAAHQQLLNKLQEQQDVHGALMIMQNDQAEQQEQQQPQPQPVKNKRGRPRKNQSAGVSKNRSGPAAATAASPTTTVALSAEMRKTRSRAQSKKPIVGQVQQKQDLQIHTVNQVRLQKTTTPATKPRSKATRTRKQDSAVKSSAQEEKSKSGITVNPVKIAQMYKDGPFLIPASLEKEGYRFKTVMYNCQDGKLSEVLFLVKHANTDIDEAMDESGASAAASASTTKIEKTIMLATSCTKRPTTLSSLVNLDHTSDSITPLFPMHINTIDQQTQERVSMMAYANRPLGTTVTDARTQRFNKMFRDDLATLIPIVVEDDRSVEEILQEHIQEIGEEIADDRRKFDQSLRDTYKASIEKRPGKRAKKNNSGQQQDTSVDEEKALADKEAAFQAYRAQKLAEFDAKSNKPELPGGKMTKANEMYWNKLLERLGYKRDRTITRGMGSAGGWDQIGKKKKKKNDEGANSASASESSGSSEIFRSQQSTEIDSSSSSDDATAVVGKKRKRSEISRSKQATGFDSSSSSAEVDENDEQPEGEESEEPAADDEESATTGEPAKTKVAERSVALQLIVVYPYDTGRMWSLHYGNPNGIRIHPSEDSQVLNFVNAKYETVTGEDNFLAHFLNAHVRNGIIPIYESFTTPMTKARFELLARTVRKQAGYFRAYQDARVLNPLELAYARYTFMIEEVVTRLDLTPGETDILKILPMPYPSEQDKVAKLAAVNGDVLSDAPVAPGFMKYLMQVAAQRQSAGMSPGLRYMLGATQGQQQQAPAVAAVEQDMVDDLMDVEALVQNHQGQGVQNSEREYQSFFV